MKSHPRTALAVFGSATLLVFAVGCGGGDGGDVCRGIDHPQRVAHAIGGGNVGRRLAGRGARQHAVQRRVGAVREDVARCTVDRLMRSLGIRGVVRGKKVITTNPDATQPCPDDKVSRASVAQMPNQLCELMPLGGASTASVQCPPLHFNRTPALQATPCMVSLSHCRAIPSRSAVPDHPHPIAELLPENRTVTEATI